jgi:hypothetical protein
MGVAGFSRFSGHARKYIFNKEVTSMLKHIRKLLIGICIFCALALTAASAPAAVVINLFPSMTSIPIGSSFDVDVVIFGLEDTDLAAYGIDLGFNDNVLDYESVSFGTELGFPTDSEVDVDTAAGFISVAETSLLFDFSGQPDAFTLFTLTFSAQEVGDSEFAFSLLDLSDPDFNAIEASAGGNVNVVPIPAAAWLLGSGVLCLVGIRRRLLS